MRNLSNEHDRKIANVLEAKYLTGSGKVRQLLRDYETQVALTWGSCTSEGSESLIRPRGRIGGPLSAC